MSVGINFVRSDCKILFDNIFFPLRALFMGEEGRLGLSSLREERMEVVSRHCKGRVLDIGCGRENKFIRDYIGLENGVGVDVYGYEGVEQVINDPTNLPFEDNSFDTVTLIAVGGHIPSEIRVAEFKEIGRILKNGGHLVMTEGEPVTQYLVHHWTPIVLKFQGKIDMDTERGMEEDEQYCMPQKELFKYLNSAPLNLKLHEKFMWGLNNVYVAECVK